MTEFSLYKRVRNLDGRHLSIKQINTLIEQFKRESKNVSYVDLFDDIYKKLIKIKTHLTTQDESLILKLSSVTKQKLISAIARPFKIRCTSKYIVFKPLKSPTKNQLLTENGFLRTGNLFKKRKPETLQGIELHYDSEDRGLGKAIVNDDVYQIITDKVVKMIESEKDLVWRKPWKSMQKYGTGAINYKTKKPYRGINSMLLNFIIPWERKKEWDLPYFLTFNQVKELGGKIKKGSEGYFVTYFQMIYKNGDKTISEKEYWSYFLRCSQGDVIENGINVCENLKDIPVLRYYRVFNAEDIEGINWEIPDNKRLKEVEPIEYAENIIKHYPQPQPKFVNKEARAFYIPIKDVVNMPFIEAFDKVPEYYSVLFHEYVHSTGHHTRLGRDLKNSYAFEELIAELGAVFLCGESGILYHTIDNSVAYLKGWKSRLTEHMKKDNKFFFRAASKAQEASEFILQRDKNNIPVSLKKTLKKPAIHKKDRSPKKMAKEIQVQKSIPFKTLKKKQTSLKGIPEKTEQAPTAPPVEEVKPPAPEIVYDNPPPSKKLNGLGVKTADDILSTNFDTLPFDGTWGEFMQDPAKNLKLVIYGKPKNGKTSFSFQFADYLTAFGPVLYVLADQGIGQATKKLITDMKVGGNSQLFFDSFRDLKSLHKLAASGEFQFIFIDLINNFQITAQQMESFFHQYPDIGFILVMESTKSGDFRGEQKWTHIVDAIVRVENFVADNTGRYGSGSYAWPKPNVSS